MNQYGFSIDSVLYTVFSIQYSDTDEILDDVIPGY